MISDVSTRPNIHNTRGNGPSKSKEIADAIDRNPGTIRTQMQSLKPLQLVEGLPGPKGGYEPTTRAFEVIDLERSEEFTPVPIERAGEPVEGLTVTEFDLLNLHHPDRRESEIHIQGPSRRLTEGDRITIGPTPASGLVVGGVVDGVNTTEGVCLLTIEDKYFDSA